MVEPEFALGAWVDQLDEVEFERVVQELVQQIIAEAAGFPVVFEEFKLIQSIEGRGLFGGLEPLPAMLSLFAKHFMVRRTLYRLRSFLEESGWRLEVDLVRFTLHRVSMNADTGQVPGQKLAIRADELVASFYGDLTTLKSATDDSVAKLLAGFWEKHQSFMQRETSYAILRVKPEASWAHIKLAYRRLITEAHPDKGGDAETFAEIQQAYEDLKRIHLS